MTISNGYVSADDLAGASGVKTGNYDGAIDRAINAASRAIDVHCGRVFYADTTATARVFEVCESGLVQIDDCQSGTITAVKSDTASDGTYATTWATTDWQAEPLNGVVNGITGHPVTRLRAIGSYSFPVPYRPLIPTVQVTAKWGWAQVPAPVVGACMTLAQALLGGEDSGVGTSGYGEFEGIRIPWDKMRLVQGDLVGYRKSGGTGLGFGLA